MKTAHLLTSSFLVLASCGCAERKDEYFPGVEYLTDEDTAKRRNTPMPDKSLLGIELYKQLQLPQCDVSPLFTPKENDSSCVMSDGTVHITGAEKPAYLWSVRADRGSAGYVGVINVRYCSRDWQRVVELAQKKFGNPGQRAVTEHPLSLTWDYADAHVELWRTDVTSNSMIVMKAQQRNAPRDGARARRL